MSLVEFVVYLLIAGICGAIGRSLGGGTSGGFLVSILLGFVGAYVGTWMARTMHLPQFALVTIAGHPFPIVWSILGAVLVVVLYHAVTRRR
jgi:uncharacterized membrane protein YeaQ/YmgE (transglycosylase-associated protein family)